MEKRNLDYESFIYSSRFTFFHQNFFTLTKHISIEGLLFLSEDKTFTNIENVVASATLKQNIDLNAIVRIFPGVEYRPEQFPGLIYRMDEPKVVILIFASGKLVCTGAKKENDVDKAVEKLKETLELKKLIYH